MRALLKAMVSSTRRKPTVTAISATEIVAQSSRANADRNEMRRTFIVSPV